MCHWWLSGGCPDVSLMGVQTCHWWVSRHVTGGCPAMSLVGVQTYHRQVSRYVTCQCWVSSFVTIYGFRLKNCHMIYIYNTYTHTCMHARTHARTHARVFSHISTPRLPLPSAATRHIYKHAHFCITILFSNKSYNKPPENSY